MGRLLVVIKVKINPYPNFGVMVFLFLGMFAPESYWHTHSRPDARGIAMQMKNNVGAITQIPVTKKL